MQALSDWLGAVVVLGVLAFLVYEAFIGQHRRTPSGWVCNTCQTWQTNPHGCDYCARHNHPTSLTPRRTP